MQPLTCSAKQEPEQEPAFNILIQANGEPRFTPNQGLSQTREQLPPRHFGSQKQLQILKGIPSFYALKFQKIL